MNKKGFIATSILYSFFIVFCAMLLMYIGLLGHNSLLINKEKDLINEELHNNIYLSDAKDGDYFRLNVYSNSSVFNSGDTINYFLVKYGGKYVFISSTPSFKLNSFELLDDLLAKIYIKYGDTTIKSRSMSNTDYNVIKGLSVKDKILNIDIDANNSGTKNGYYLLAKNPYSSSGVFNVSNNTYGSSVSNIDNTFIRLTFDISNNKRILSGDGTFSNPYIMEGGAST